ncbi:MULTISPECIES: LCP family glycopolymer transferase [Bacillus]|uniref:LCP family glycopolymer transferase n=1 Tax=Bacillus TaxID=1386 RepID=UPI000494E16D|nr:MULTISPECIES: LCP family protein [Bacillus]MBG9915523.1 trascriptional regulator [Bacillus sonorensis]MDR4958753.1 LCP family protein [Bacillus sonorensis]MEC0338986.1 LCP family protein [Bacillus sonorensis]MEC0428264.1 LCP family protein [Bacillus sonorensis]MEC0458219.1 LCP family protein [Bacillus sonorensis]
MVKMRKRKLKIKNIILLVLALLMTVGGLVSYGVYRNVAKSISNMYEPLKRDSEQQNAAASHDPISILLLGIDERPGDKGRPDSMVVMTVNPETKKTTMTSIPRDTRVFIRSKNTFSKMNSAYTYGGIEGTVQTVEQFLNIPINYYIKVNMDGFKDIVDAVGGVTVNNRIDFTLEGVHLSKGKQHLNGKTALTYARMRKDDPRGDFGRQQRQREIINQIIHEGAQLKSLANYQEILTALEKNVKTNLTLDKMIDIQSSYKEAAKNIKQIEIEGEDKKMDGLWYHIVTDEKRKEISKKLRRQLNLKS